MKLPDHVLSCAVMRRQPSVFPADPVGFLLPNHNHPHPIQLPSIMPPGVEIINGKKTFIPIGISCFSTPSSTH